MSKVMTFTASGEVRGLFFSESGNPERSLGAVPVRASHIVVDDHGFFRVDMSPMAELFKKPEWGICLLPKHGSHARAVKAEEAWLLENYIRGPG